MLERFENQMRIRVVDPDEEHAPLKDHVGLVVRLRMQDESAWIRMVDPLPEGVAVFPKDDERRDHVILWPDECDQLLLAE